MNKCHSLPTLHGIWRVRIYWLIVKTHKNLKREVGVAIKVREQVAKKLLATLPLLFVSVQASTVPAQ